MILFAMLSLLGPVSHAQSKELPLGSPPRDDPAYLQYLVELDRIDDMTAARETPQVDLGMVSVVDPWDPSAHLGYLFAAHTDPTLGLPATSRTEHWFVSDPTLVEDPARAFLLTMQDPYCADPVSWLPKSWEADAYMAIDFVYVVGPGAWAGLGYAGSQVQRTSFELVQDGVQVGAMLRERHLKPDLTFSHYVEHWLFFDDPVVGEFAVLRKEGDELLVTPETFQFSTTAAFFWSYAGTELKAYAKPTYVPTVGSSSSF